MLPIIELNFGFGDAENYKLKDKKELFNKIFLKTEELDKLCESNTYFVMGEKGTGRTAYAMYMVNTSYNNNSSAIKFLRETEYQKFLALKKQKHLTLSDYTDVWKVILYLIMAEEISRTDLQGNILGGATKFRNLRKAIAEYYNNAFSPEIQYAINFADQSKETAEILAKYFKVGSEKVENISFSETKFQINLLYIQRKFEETFSSLKLKRNHILFIDGIDIRPERIPYDDYHECVKGLANALWTINSDFFSSIKGSQGRLRVVLLLRPDIFQSLGLQNQSNKIKDNSVLLDWRTNYGDYRNSSLFAMADKLLAVNQEEELKLGQAWDYYFPYEAVDHRTRTRKDSPFITFLRFSLFRPRDIVSMLENLQENFVQEKRHSTHFEERDFDSPKFRSKHSDYLLGQIKDHLAFYHTGQDYELFLKFFEYLNGRPRFDYNVFIAAYEKLDKYLTVNKFSKPLFFETPDIFLQFLYDLNVVCYVEYARDEHYVRWCFRERSYANLFPKIKIGLTYEVHYGLRKALNLGKPVAKYYQS